MQPLPADRRSWRVILLEHFRAGLNATEAYRACIETYGERALSVSTCRYWYRRFNDGNFAMEDRRRTGQPRKFEDSQLEELLQQIPTPTLRQLARQLRVSISTITSRLQIMGIIHKNGKWVRDPNLR